MMMHPSRIWIDPSKESDDWTADSREALPSEAEYVSVEALTEAIEKARNTLTANVGTGYAYEYAFNLAVSAIKGVRR